MEHTELEVATKHQEEQVDKIISVESSDYNEQAKNQNYCEEGNEDTIHVIEPWGKDDTLLEFMRVTTEMKVTMYTHLELTPTQELNYVTSPWTSSMWALDFMGVINPPSGEGHKFILVAIEYYTKWVEAISLKIAIQKHIINFIKEYIICRFGIPQRLIMDNGTNFIGKDVIEFCKKMRIEQIFSSVYYSQGNGQAKATNKTIKKILAKTIQQSGKDWHDKLPYALWAYRTSMRTTT